MDDATDSNGRNVQADLSSKQTIAQRISAEVAARILGGELKPGAPLREQEMSSRYGVSRHVIREALRLLAAEGMADYSSFKGARVPLLTRADVEDIYRARDFVEVSALRQSGAGVARTLAQIHQQYSQAVGRADWDAAFALDVDFHAAIVACAGSERISQWHRELMRGMRLAHLVSPRFNEQGLAESVDHHARIVLALTAGDAEAGAQALHDHLVLSERMITGDSGA